MSWFYSQKIHFRCLIPNFQRISFCCFKSLSVWWFVQQWKEWRLRSFNKSRFYITVMLSQDYEFLVASRYYIQISLIFIALLICWCHHQFMISAFPPSPRACQGEGSICLEADSLQCLNSNIKNARTCVRVCNKNKQIQCWSTSMVVFMNLAYGGQALYHPTETEPKTSE